ncbi:MAG: hypothetical protein AB7S44_02045 [Spirochaetales bacterium]
MNKRQLVQFYKRAFIEFLLLIPLFIYLDGVLTNAGDFTKISIYVLIGLVVVSVVELIRYKKITKNKK